MMLINVALERHIWWVGEGGQISVIVCTRIQLQVDDKKKRSNLDKHRLWKKGVLAMWLFVR